MEQLAEQMGWWSGGGGRVLRVMGVGLHGKECDGGFQACFVS